MKILLWIYTLYAAVLFILLMLIFGLFIVIPLLLSPAGGKLSFLFIRLWAGIWSFLVGIRYKIQGQNNIDPTKPYIYIFNHRSFVDATVIPMAIHQEIRAIGKKELSRIPIFGFVVSRVAVWVDRKDTASRKASVEKLKKILAQGISIVVAPEGTRNDSENLLLPFQKGAFRIALETGTAILPMSIHGADSIMKRGSFCMRPGRIHVSFGAPIFPLGPYCEEGYEALAAESFQQLKKMLS
jgi:1-acyl-sn-glycerol-3-phosphate acyltransferase